MDAPHDDRPPAVVQTCSPREEERAHVEVRSQIVDRGLVSATLEGSSGSHTTTKSKFQPSFDGKLVASSGSRSLEATTLCSTRRLPCRELKVDEVESNEDIRAGARFGQFAATFIDFLAAQVRAR